MKFAGCVGRSAFAGISSLRGLTQGDTVLLAEVMSECSYVRHHVKKLVLVLSAMRHFAETLATRGIEVDYVTLDTQGNTQSLLGEIVSASARHRPDRIIVTEPGEWRVLVDMREWAAATGCAVEISADDRFLSSRNGFQRWAEGKRAPRMEFFYREMRRRRVILMDSGEPAGGRWNFDAENRKRLPVGTPVPSPLRPEPDKITRDVMALVAERIPGNIGQVDGFAFPVTAHAAESVLDHFFRHRLTRFGEWQDAMRAGTPFLFHSLISAALNRGLLDPLDICRRAEARWRSGDAPLNAVEGFVRQILGWREFTRGIYWLHMPRYARLNALAAGRKLPAFYWTAETNMRCMADAIGQTIEHAYAHHIQRLMITGNFALLAALDPDEVDAWYLAVHADAYEWVEMPNTRGMALFADGGIVGSKPYAASGAYINRMSDSCRGCAYDVSDATGRNSCPFNALYWDFVGRHAERFAANTRMAMPLRNWAAMPAGKRAALRARAADVLAKLDAGEIRGIAFGKQG